MTELRSVLVSGLMLQVSERSRYLHLMLCENQTSPFEPVGYFKPGLVQG